jgi:RHS repeat-associated protein
MSGRNQQGDYRYAYQGQEKDPETGWEAFELRMYDGRVGRWMTTDPYSQYHSPYLAMGNNPISNIDPDGGCVGADCPDFLGGEFIVFEYVQDITKVEYFKIGVNGDVSLGHGYFFETWEFTHDRYYPLSREYPDDPASQLLADPHFTSNDFARNIDFGELSPDHTKGASYAQRLITLSAGGGVWAESHSFNGTVYSYEGTSESSGGERIHRTQIFYNQGLFRPSPLFQLRGTIKVHSKELDLIGSGAAAYNVRVVITRRTVYTNTQPGVNPIEYF